MSYCGEQSIVKGDATHQVAVTLRCRAWTCADCEPQRKAQLIAQAIGGSPRTFLTLTIRRSVCKTPNEAAKRLSHAWRLLRLRLMRKYKLARLPFFAVFEAHQSGWPHMHILLRAPYLDWRFIKSVMAELLDSPHIRIERIDAHRRVATYCAKYCGKAAHKFGTAKRYWQSPDYDLREPADPREKPLPGEGWEIWRRTIDQWVVAWFELGWDVDRPSRHKAVGRPEPPGSAEP